MYSNKINVLELLALLKQHNVTTVVLCPGSRNIPLVQSMANDSDFACYSITDERSAGFFALGLALKLNQPVAVCCTSGSALVNLHPAVTEAFYQQVPLLVISADRPVAWVGQMDGQTLPQAHVFGSLVKHSVDLPEIKDKQDLWYCNRLINEALLALNFQTAGPVHINVPISEPFFSFDVTSLPQVRTIRRFEPYQFNSLVSLLAATQDKADNESLAQDKAETWALAESALDSVSGFSCDSISSINSNYLTDNSRSLPDFSALVEACRMLLCRFPKIMLIIGQNTFGVDCLQNLSEQDKQLITSHVLVVEESLSNLSLEHTCDKIDRALLLPLVKDNTELVPQVVITLGGHIISKRLKHYLRTQQPLMHWHIAPDGAIVDLYHCLSHVLVCQPHKFMLSFVQAISSLISNNKEQSLALENGASLWQVQSQSFVKQWLGLSQKVLAPSFAYSQMKAIGQVIEALPPGSVLHLANSSTVRYAQLFKLPQYQGDDKIKVFSNRGVNGIEGSLSTAIGFAAADSSRLNFILIGDLSFFYDLNALWNEHISSNVRILLLNNGGGEIFHALPNLHLTAKAQHFVTATHQTSAQGWVESQGFNYLVAHDQGELDVALNSFMQPLSAKLSTPTNPALTALDISSSSGLANLDVATTVSENVAHIGSLNTLEPSGNMQKPMVLEVFTSQEEDTRMLKSYMQQLQALS